MKKFVLCIICIIMLCGCSNEESEELKIYNNYITTLKQTEKTTDKLPFNISIYVDKIIDTEVMYRVIIDNPKIALRNIKTLVIHDKYTEDVFPSSGIFDDKLNLIPGLINKTSNYVEGIILVGYIPYEEELTSLNATFKLLFEYTDDDDITHTVFYSTKK